MNSSLKFFWKLNTIWLFHFKQKVKYNSALHPPTTYQPWVPMNHITAVDLLRLHWLSLYIMHYVRLGCRWRYGFGQVVSMPIYIVLDSRSAYQVICWYRLCPSSQLIRTALGRSENGNYPAGEFLTSGHFIHCSNHSENLATTWSFINICDGFIPFQTSRGGRMSRPSASRSGRSGNPKVAGSNPKPLKLILVAS